jgi:hypothetical protein
MHAELLDEGLCKGYKASSAVATLQHTGCVQSICKSQTLFWAGRRACWVCYSLRSAQQHSDCYFEAHTFSRGQEGGLCSAVQSTPRQHRMAFLLARVGPKGAAGAAAGLASLPAVAECRPATASGPVASPARHAKVGLFLSSDTIGDGLHLRSSCIHAGAHNQRHRLFPCLSGR